MEGIDFQELFFELDLDHSLHGGNLICPFCQKKSFKDYRDGKAYCHSCKWSGNAIRLYVEMKHVTKQEAYNALVELYKLERIKPKQKTTQEAVDSLSKDLEFLAWCRMHFAFYGSDRIGMRHCQEQAGMSRSQFSKIINGHFDQVSPRSWHTALLILRQTIDIKGFRRDIKEGKLLWERKVVDCGLIEDAKRYR